MNPVWREGNEVELLINGEAFFPSVFSSIRKATQRVLLETFIIFDDDVGRELKSALIEAAANGAHVEIMVDGYGSAEINDDYVAELTKAGIVVHMFDPRPRVLGYRTNLFRRLHRKIVVVDDDEAYVGGINFSCDHLAAYGPKTKQDYAVRVRGPIVADIHKSSSELFQQAPGSKVNMKVAQPQQQEPMGNAAIELAIRDNENHRNEIEKRYLAAIRSASQRIIIANAYFYPGYRLLRELRRAARRGVKVTLILQGEPDMPWVRVVAQLLYGYLIKDGIVIYEYCRRPLHGKVALVDDNWSTVGSSNLDPLSLSLNLEANLVIRDSNLNQQLFTHFEELIASECQQITRKKAQRGYWWRAPISYFFYHFTRHFPALMGLLPAHVPRLKPALPDSPDSESSLTTLEANQK